MNILTNTKLLENAFKSIAQPVLINDVPHQAFITNAHLGMQSRRHMHSLGLFHQGDIVRIGDEAYMVVEDVVILRGAKYKSTIEVCNYIITTPEKIIGEEIVGYDDLGKPIYKTFTETGYPVPVIVKSEKVSISGGTIRINNSTLTVLIQNTPANKDIMKVNVQFKMYDRDWKITNIDLTRNGLIELSVDRQAG